MLYSAERLYEMPEYMVHLGDCINSIAYDNGLFWETVWNHPANAKLKVERKDPNILLPGDSVFVPDKRIKREPRPTDQHHKFVLRGVPAKLSLRITVNDEPRRNEPYVLTIDGRTRRGMTDGDGNISVPILPNAQSGRLVVGTGANALEFQLGLGHLNPIETVSGVKARLNNLGYPCGEPDEVWTEEAKRALAAFQSGKGLPATGVVDGATRQMLRQAADRI